MIDSIMGLAQPGAAPRLQLDSGIPEMPSPDHMSAAAAYLHGTGHLPGLNDTPSAAPAVAQPDLLRANRSAEHATVSSLADMFG